MAMLNNQRVAIKIYKLLYVMEFFLWFSIQMFDYQGFFTAVGDVILEATSSHYCNGCGYSQD